MRYRFLRFPDGKPKAVAFSYDDAVRSDLQLAEVCGQYGIKCTFNVSTGWIAPERKTKNLTPEELIELQNQGHELAIHGHLHSAPGLNRSIDTIHELARCRMILEQLTGKIIRGMAFPDSGITNLQNGATQEDIANILRMLDIAYARTLAGDNNLFSLPSNWHSWVPTAHHKNPKVLQWAEQFVSMDVNSGYISSRWPKLFYLWGHSYEFRDDDNWELLEKLCQILGNRDDTWYATNMEIYDYVQAYHCLVFSIDNAMVYNPSLKTVWFWQDEVLYEVPAGQTVLLNS